MERRYCLLPGCDVDITERAENCKYCEDRHRTKHFKQRREAERLEAEAKAARRTGNGQNGSGRRKSGAQVSYVKAVAACEAALLEGLLRGQPSESTIPLVARRFMSEALPAKQRERMEAGR